MTALSLLYYLLQQKIYLKTKNIFNIIKNLISPASPPSDDDEFKESLKFLTQIGQSFKSYSDKFNSYNRFIDAQNKEFLMTLQNIKDPVIGIDTQGKIILFNQSASDFTGLSTKDTLGNQLNTTLKFYDKNKELPLQTLIPLKPGAQQGIIVQAPEIKIVSESKESYADITVSTIKEGPIINLGAIISLHDTTKEKQLEAMKLDFVSMAAHELRTPLTTIKSYISVFVSENEKKLSEDQMMFIRRINTASQQLSALVENLLSVSRVERGAMSLTLKLMDWVSNVKQATEQFEQRAKEKRMELEFIQPTSPIPQVRADMVRINEVLSNFLSNALSYTEPGGKITVSIETKDNQVITNVTDTGRGIPKDSLSHLFSKFFRISGNTDTQASKGNGLGLYISKAIVELHKGKIWAESEGSNKGSTFSFSLPAAETAPININVLTKSL